MQKFVAALFALVLALGAVRPVTAYPPIARDQPDLAIDGTTRATVIEKMLAALERGYVFPEVATRLVADIRRRVHKQEYENIASARILAAVLTDNLQQLSRDRHLRVVYSHKPLSTLQQPAQAERFNSWRNHGFQKVERLAGNIGYLELHGFVTPAQAAETAAAAMRFVAYTDALIIDLRANGGGSPRMVALLSSYLLEGKPVHLNTIYARPNDSKSETWTSADLPSPRFLDKEVYLLTSRKTFSAAEEFAYNLKALGRVTIVGETTAGGAHPGSLERLDEHFGVFIPYARSVNPITGTNWEGTGVAPDIAVPAELALKTAHIAAMEKVLARSSDEFASDDLRKSIAAAQVELDELKKKLASVPSGRMQHSARIDAG
ncbi:S41 family peptidase [Gloeobacter violaceus]|uniref:Glr2547 protein n=1 Tax=Gloeobacter violaceus (strain ATCC 29082 / PCC 7421) TaxID=251221 RepID=Q7NHI8_GLOVI|nr:S41 family peptidase [Gloeobacter violaceus]BAC90488.1 glr2547 [Gloeobacter violaceus PCC 7421]